jgi:hypothetical protein
MTSQFSESSIKTPQQGRWVVPNPRIPRTFGWLNVVFGVILLLAGAYSVAMFFLAPRVLRWVQGQVQPLIDFQKQQRDSKIAELKKQEEAAKTEAEKKEFQDRRAAIESAAAPPNDMFADIQNWNIYNDRRVATYFWREVSAGILLNLLMIIAGIGLLRAAEWARRLTVGVSWIKIARRLAMIATTMLLIMPITTGKVREVYAKMDAQIAKGGGRTPPFPLTSMAPIIAVATAAGTVFEGVVASVYPALAIWYLTRPRARAACLTASSSRPPKPVIELGETW